eukprot:Platyproteum_vivax@DN7231_c0_g1_i1.p1
MGRIVGDRELSDSTIYMAYYTIVHFLQGNVSGTQQGLLEIPASDMTEAVWDYIFCQTSEVPVCAVSADKLNTMRSAFQYWYPMDLRISGKDLIGNHLTMSLYNHAAIWEDRAMWPRGFYCNGHLLVDAEKMSKSKGNFLTLREAMEEFSTDATRLVLADSGDGVEDSNFEKACANQLILRLTAFEVFVQELVNGDTPLRPADSPLTWMDRLFLNEMKGMTNLAKDAYLSLTYREAVKYSWFDFQNLKDSYRNYCDADNMHHSVIHMFIETQCKVMSPLCPHIAENIYSILNKKVLVVEESWPEFDEPVDSVLQLKYQSLMKSMRSFRDAREKVLNVKKGGGTAPTHGIIYTAAAYPEWQQETLKVLQKAPLDENNDVPADYMRTLKADPAIAALGPLGKKALGFASFVMKNEVKAMGAKALDLTLAFDEHQLLLQVESLIKKQLQLTELLIVPNTETPPNDKADVRALAVPNKPQIHLFKL